MRRRTIEALYVGAVTGFAALWWLLPDAPRSGLLSGLFLALLGPTAVPWGGLQWVVGALVRDLTPEGAPRTWLLGTAFALVTAVCAAADVGLGRLLTLVARAVRDRWASCRAGRAVTA